MKHQPDKNTLKIRKWIGKNSRSNPKRLRAFLEERGCSSHGITHVLSGQDCGKLRSEVVTQFKIK